MRIIRLVAAAVLIPAGLVFGTTGPTASAADGKESGLLTLQVLPDGLAVTV